MIRPLFRPFQLCAAALTLTLVTAIAARADVDIQEVTSPSGLTAWLVEDHTIPFTALEIRFRGGTSLDAPDARGAVYLMTALLEEGAGDLDSRGFAEAKENLAASFTYDNSDDAVSVSAQFLSENREAAIDLLRSSLVAPRFDQDAIDRVRGQILSGLASDAKDPDDIAANAFAAHMYRDHPYATSGKGTPDSVAALTRDDIIAAHGGVFARDRVYIGAVGDITPEELGAIVDELLADLPAEGAPMPGPAELIVTGGTTVIPFETPQSVVLFGQPGMKRDDPDFFAAMIATHILGGSGESRLMQEVRVKRGLTYGVYSYLAPKDWAAVLVGRVASANDRVAEAVEVIGEEWARIAEDGVTQDELDAAKTFLTGAYPLRFKGNSRIARILVGMQMEDLPIDYIPGRNDKVNAVQLSDVNRVAGELFRPDDLHFVIVGSPEGIEPGTN